MSINSLANAAVARRPETVPAGVPKGLGEIAWASTMPPAVAAIAAVTPQAEAPPEKPMSAIDTASNVLFGYIPTEILTLYVAVLAAIHRPDDAVRPALWIAFACFLVATPLVVWLVYAAKVKALGQPLPLAPGTWPVWEMTAAIVAYCAWALALPNTPFAQFKDTWYSSALSGVIVLVASTTLGLLAPFFQRPLKT